MYLQFLRLNKERLFKISFEDSKTLCAFNETNIFKGQPLSRALFILNFQERFTFKITPLSMDVVVRILNLSFVIIFELYVNAKLHSRIGPFLVD